MHGYVGTRYLANGRVPKDTEMDDCPHVLRKRANGE